MNALEKELASNPSAKYGTRCTVAKLLGHLPADEAASWDATLRNPDAGTDKQKAEALNRLLGSDILYNPVRNHRQGRCRCEPLEN